MKMTRLVGPGNRLTADLAGIGLPEVPLVGIHNETRAGTGLAPHVHPGAMEICYLVRGERTYHADGRDYTFRGNEVFVTFPDELHGSGVHIHGKGMLYWTQVRLPRTRRAFLGLSAAEAEPLVRGLRNLPVRHFRGTRQLQVLFEEIVRLCREAPPAPLHRLEVASRLVAWLLTVIRCAGTSRARTVTPDIQRALDRIDAQADEVPPLVALARAAGLSLSRFKAKFREQLGMPPADYLLRRKVEQARALLARRDSSVTDVAYRLGFSSSQYFATVFKRYTGVRPRDVRREAAGQGARAGRR